MHMSDFTNSQIHDRSNRVECTLMTGENAQVDIRAGTVLGCDAVRGSTPQHDHSATHVHIQDGTTDSPAFVMVTECRHGYQWGRTIAHSKVENVEFLSIII